MESIPQILPLFQQAFPVNLEKSYPILPRWGIRLAGEYGELVTSERRTNAIGSFLWRTPMASDGIFSNRTEEQLIKRWTDKNLKQKHLSEQVVYNENFLVFPTPTVSGNTNKKGSSKKSGNGLSIVVGGKLNPQWVEWLMGFPIGWTDLEDLEMQ